MRDAHTEHRRRVRLEAGLLTRVASIFPVGPHSPFVLLFRTGKDLGVVLEWPHRLCGSDLPGSNCWQGSPSARVDVAPAFGV